MCGCELLGARGGTEPVAWSSIVLKGGGKERHDLFAVEGSCWSSIIFSLARQSVGMYFTICIAPASQSGQQSDAIRGHQVSLLIAVFKNLFRQNHGSHCCISWSYRAADELWCWPLRLLFKLSNDKDPAVITVLGNKESQASLKSTGLKKTQQKNPYTNPVHSQAGLKCRIWFNPFDASKSWKLTWPPRCPS